MSVDVATEVVIDRPIARVAGYATHASNARCVSSPTSFGRRLDYTYELVEPVPQERITAPSSTERPDVPRGGFSASCQVVGRWVSYMRVATTSPERVVRAATAQMAAVMEMRSARVPARRAPTAKPESRHSR